MADEDVERVEQALRRWLESVGEASYDPYDGLSGRFPWRLAARHRLAARGLSQIVKSSPVNVRPLLGIRKRILSKSVSDLASAALLRRRLGTDLTAAAASRTWLALLRSEAVPGYSGACWALATPYVTRFTESRGGDPNLFWTINAAIAFLESYEMDGRAQDLAIARSAVDFVRRDLGVVDAGEDGVWLRYFIDHDAIVLNVAAMGGALFRRVAWHTGETELADLGRRAVRFVLRHQDANGSWPYALGPRGRWVDGFHTGYVLEALLQGALRDGDDTERAALRRGIEFYVRWLFDADDLPRYTDARRYPIDVQNCAQAIQTLSRLAWLDPQHADHALRVARAVTRALFVEVTGGDAPRAYFAASRGRFFTNRVAYVRWGQAPMLLALAALLAARRGLRPTWETARPSPPV